MTVALALGLASLAIWLVLLLARGGFWLLRDYDRRDGEEPPDPPRWPPVVAVVPARDEADVIALSVGSLVTQDYPGPFRVVLVDDGSTDGTAAAARAAADAAGQGHRLEIVPGSPPPQGWTGKLWALQTGIRRIAEEDPDYLLLTDADIGHLPSTLRSLVARAEAGRLSLVSLMALLSCTTRVERFLIPAFVFFFRMLYPFAWVADPRARTAAGAGGVMLVRRASLERAGGIAAVRSEIIDDCALAARLKAVGPIWLGLTHRAVSLRPYVSVAEIGRMVSRSAYAQLRYSPLLLLGTLLGLGLVYVVPPALAVFGTGAARTTGFVAFVLMCVAFGPMLRFYAVSPLWALALPAIALTYAWFTLLSAVQVWRGRGGMWKGRAQAQVGGQPGREAEAGP